MSNSLTRMAPGTLAVTGDDAADRLLNGNPLALLIGMLLDQQIPIEWAFIGPFRLQERLGHDLDASLIAAMDPADLETVVVAKPALHRFPTAMAGRIHELSCHLVQRYEGDPELIWLDAEDGADLFERLRGLPGFGPEKSKILMAVLAKRFTITPDGWAEIAAPFSDGLPRTVADIDGPESLARVRDWKRAQKAKGKGKAE